MPNRILKDSICTSPNIDTLSREAEVFFYRLLVQRDDYGRMESDLSNLLSRCYPLRLSSISQESVQGWMAELRQADLQQCARKRIVAQRGEKCEKCGSRAIVELHHITRAKDGGTFADENCILLCWLCHQRAHGNTPGRNGLRSYNAARKRLGEI